MPRKGRPKPIGPAKGNRTDLPAQAPTGGAYGSHAPLIAAQQAIPLPGPGAPVGPPPQGGPPGAGPPMPGGSAPASGGPQELMAALQAAQNHAAPNVGLGGPTQRPDEPVTAGIPLGPGPGPEALGLPPQGAGSMADLLQRMADQTGVSTLASLAERARTLAQ